MHVDVRPPDHVHLGLRRQEPTKSSPTLPGVELIARGLATGFGVGLLLMVGTQAGVAQLAVLGVIAIAAAFLSWDR